MAEETTTVYTVSEAATLLAVHPNTLRRWETQGKVRPAYTLGGQRRYTVVEINRLRQEMGLPEIESPAPNKNKPM